MKNILKQKTIGINPLDEYISSREVKETAEEQQFLEVQTKQQKQRVTIHVSIDLIDRVKNAVYWEPGLTLAAFAEDALSRALDELEAQRGTPYPNRKDRQLRGGRPLK